MLSPLSGRRANRGEFVAYLVTRDHKRLGGIRFLRLKMK